MRVNVALGFVGFLTAAGTAHADDPAFAIGSSPTYVVLGGATTGGTVALSDRGYFLGGELSVARLRAGNTVGLYADGYYDWGVNATYATGGIELGHKLFGIDGGVAARFASGNTDVGFSGRLYVGLGVFSLYGRYMHFSSMTEDNVIQVGIELKLPLATFGGHL